MLRGRREGNLLLGKLPNGSSAKGSKLQENQHIPLHFHVDEELELEALVGAGKESLVRTDAEQVAEGFAACLRVWDSSVENCAVASVVAFVPSAGLPSAAAVAAAAVDCTVAAVDEHTSAAVAAVAVAVADGHTSVAAVAAEQSVAAFRELEAEEDYQVVPVEEESKATAAGLGAVEEVLVEEVGWDAEEAGWGAAVVIVRAAPARVESSQMMACWLC